jgi:hypothetical protein
MACTTKTLDYKCGCSTDVTGSAAYLRDQRFDISARLCPVCANALSERQSQATQRATELNKDLPSLTGTQKQIDWAETIRAKQAPGLRSLLATARTADATGQLLKLLQRADAKAWIDTRGRFYDHIWASITLYRHTPA